MKIIQSLNTFGNDPERNKCGFSTKRAMKAFMEKSYEIHKEIADYTLYTDYYGYEEVKHFINEEDIEVIEFPIILNDRIPYIGKFQVQELQKEPYIHVDIDAILYEIPENVKDIICEKWRSTSHGRETAKFNIDKTGLNRIICSGIIGFTDMKFKDEYILKVFENFGKLENDHNITFETCFTIEETMLTRMVLDNNKLVTTCECYNHLQGRIK